MRRLPAEGVGSDPAALWRRGLAHVLDLFTVFFSMFALVLLGLAGPMERFADAVATEPWGRALAPQLLFVALLVLYRFGFVARQGQTPGQDLVRVEVVGAAIAGREPPARLRCLVRALLPSVPFLVPDLRVAGLVVAGLGASALLRSDRRALHDLASGTWIVGRVPPEVDAASEGGGEEGEVDFGPLDQLRREHGWLERLLRRGR